MDGDPSLSNSANGSEESDRQSIYRRIKEVRQDLEQLLSIGVANAFAGKLVLSDEFSNSWNELVGERIGELSVLAGLNAEDHAHDLRSVYVALNETLQAQLRAKKRSANTRTYLQPLAEQ